MATEAALEHDLNKAATLLPAIALCLLAATGRAATAVVIVEGLGGNDRYRGEFAGQVERLEAASATLSPPPEIRVFRATAEYRDALLAHLRELAARLDDADLVIVYLVGHGSYDDHEYKFNMPGPDLTDAEFREAFEGLPAENLVVVNTSSASGAAHDAWQDDARTIITATRSGVERHATRFGGYFVAALDDPGADLDKNERITAREAFDYASRAVDDYFESNGQLATEHARITGERAGRITLAALGGPREAPADPALDPLLAERDALNARIEELRLARDDMPTDEYEARLLELMLELATAEEAIEARRGDGEDRE